MKSAIAAFAALALAAPVLAQEDAPPAPPPCQDESYRAFDFWLGAWRVTDPEGSFQGNNVITQAEDGCLILEHWTSANGGTGQSYNFYDPGLQKWRQVWVSGGGVIDYAGGLTETGSMKLQGEIAYHNGAAFPFTGEWTLQDDGTVRQHFEQFNPETETWDPWFTGIYTRVDSAE
ncbi:MAG: hypothetical protein AAFX03_07280 [Pseudomonadota bacterium]